ncbi:MAG: hypothetical protein LDL19_04340 [Thiobacillus sp.]|nr:hypothetical protein [Thiobacillus sp.]
MKTVLAFVLVIAGVLPLPSHADGGAMLLEHHLELDTTTPAVTDYRVDGMYTLHESLRNATGKAWSGLHIELVRQRGTHFVPVSASDGVSFMRAEPTLAWRPTVEVRIDGHYLGLAGGGWQLQRSEAATALEMRFEEIPVAPGALVQLRLRVLNTHDTTWRLRYTPKLAPGESG